MVGVRWPDASRALATARALLERGYIVLTGGVRGDCLTLSPPLTIAPELLSAFVAALDACAPAS
jgi:4-aminobutyrate aminotransferase-like enzyme